MGFRNSPKVRLAAVFVGIGNGTPCPLRRDAAVEHLPHFMGLVLSLPIKY